MKRASPGVNIVARTLHYMHSQLDHEDIETSAQFELLNNTNRASIENQMTKS